jgi:hypothetical protein
MRDILLEILGAPIPARDAALAMLDATLAMLYSPLAVHGAGPAVRRRRRVDTEPGLEPRVSPAGGRCAEKATLFPSRGACDQRLAMPAPCVAAVRCAARVTAAVVGSGVRLERCHMKYAISPGNSPSRAQVRVTLG